MNSLVPPADDTSAVESAVGPDSGSHLANELTVQHYRDLLDAGVERAATALSRARRPFTGVSATHLERVVSGIDLDRPLGDPHSALDELERVYLRDAVYFHHPRYLAHLNCPVVIPALLGEAILSAVNSSLDTWDQSAGATLIERHLIDWTARRLGLGLAADGVFTSGGTQSNLHALLLAREEACERARRDSPTARTAELLPRLRVLTSQDGHFSITKAATLLGLGGDAVISVPSDRERRMRTTALAREIERCHDEGLVPMAVVATAGTTDFGSIDPLPDIVEVCRRAGVWLHVDAAYGCGLLVSRWRALLDGVEHADSVTVDYHKSFFQPVSSSAVLVRERASLRHATHHADYLNPARDAATHTPNQVDKSIQTTRRFDALKLWLTLRIMGASGIGELFDAVLTRAGEAWRLLADDPRFEVVTRPQLSTLVFRYLPPSGTTPELCDRANLHARDALLSSGEAVVARTSVDGRSHLKFTLLNPRTSRSDIAEVLDLIAEHAQRYLSERTDRLNRSRAS